MGRHGKRPDKPGRGTVRPTVPAAPKAGGDVASLLLRSATAPPTLPAPPPLAVQPPSGSQMPPEQVIAAHRQIAKAHADDAFTVAAALALIASVDAGAISADERQRLESIGENAQTPVQGRVRAWFALGQALDRQAQYDAAFRAYDRGNRLKAATVDMAGVVRREVEVAPTFPRAFTPQFLARWTGRGHPSRAPIFVVGSPRSGTTLIEQILASHRLVQGMGETKVMHEVAGGRLYWPLPDDAPADVVRQIGAAYLRGVRELGWNRGERFVDKMPRNYFMVGVIALALPRAIILHSVRDPMDTCLSLYRSLFDEGNEFSYDLAEIGRTYVRYRDLMEHWATVLPGRVIDVRHEELVADPEGRIRWLVTEACGLPWDETCLRYHENRREVHTLSAEQVRRPMFTSSVGRWRRYERHLAPLIEALGPYAPKAG